MSGFDSEREKEKRRRRLKAPFFFLLLSGVLLVVLAASVSAVTISATNFQCFDSVVVGNRYCKVDVKVQATGQYEEGLIELGFNDARPIVKTMNFFQQLQPCSSAFPYNTIFKYSVGSVGNYESIQKTLIARSIPDGTYEPYLIHVTGCFKDGGIFKLPNPDSQIPKTPVIFGVANANVNDQCDNPYTALLWVRSHGDLACTEALCFNAESTTSSEAKCVKRGVCAEGAEQWTTCPSGSSFVVRRCITGSWVETGEKCVGQPLPVTPPPTTPETVKASFGGLGGVNFTTVYLTGGAVLIGWFVLRRFGILKL